MLVSIRLFYLWCFRSTEEFKTGCLVKVEIELISMTHSMINSNSLKKTVRAFLDFDCKKGDKIFQKL